MFYKCWMKSSSIAFLLFLSYSNVSYSAEWLPIAGVPKPAFGIENESPNVPTGWDSDVPGFYYVDRSNNNATDDNTYGNPLKPRLTIPNPIPAGSVVEVHGLYDQDITINSLGTIDKPVYVKGASDADRAIFASRVVIKGSYLTVENFINKPRAPESSHGVQIPEGTSHITIRNGEVSGEGSVGRKGNISIGSWGYSGVDKSKNIVIYNMNIHDLGDRDATFDQDAHGITLNGSSENVWILHNTIHRVSGDGVQIEAQHNRGIDKIQNIYLAKNTIYDNKQSGLWIKHAKNVVISSNTMSNMTASDSSSGQCTGFQYASHNFWFINNSLYDCGQGIMAASDDGEHGGEKNVYYIGNVIYKINSPNSSNPHQSGGITIRMPNTNHYVVSNTIDDTDVGLSAPISSGKLFIYNNIFSNRNEPNNSDLYLESVADNSEIDNNIIHSSNDFKISWNGNYNSLSNFKTSTSKCDSCIENNPKFKNVSLRDYRLNLDSPAVNKGSSINQELLSAFQLSFGFELSLDKEGFVVPVNAWDIGAFEVNEGELELTKPEAPTDIEVIKK